MLVPVRIYVHRHPDSVAAIRRTNQSTSLLSVVCWILIIFNTTGWPLRPNRVLYEIALLAAIRNLRNPDPPL